MTKSDRTTRVVGTAAEGWQGRDLHAKVLRWSITLAPLLVAAAVSISLNQLLPAASSWLWAIARVVIIAALSMTTITIVERAGRRLLPLSTLLRLSLVFPDHTPSRFKLALKAGSGKRMERAITEARTHGLSQDRAQAAEQLVVLSTAIGAHDRRTRGHSERVRLYAELLGEELHLGNEDRHKLQWAALIHDMGKITVPPEILNKRGKPNEAEWSILQQHPSRGEELVRPVADWLGEWIHAVGGHHEKWDGTGYPRQLAAHDIPRAAAMVAVADAFEVMTAVRSYKSAMSLADARAELTRCSGTHFSPDLVRAFVNISLPKLRRAGGALASLAHLPFVGKLLTASAKAPEAWGYGLSNLANAGGSAVAAAAVTGLLIAAPATADSHEPNSPVTAAAVDAGPMSPAVPSNDRDIAPVSTAPRDFDARSGDSTNSVPTTLQHADTTAAPAAGASAQTAIPGRASAVPSLAGPSTTIPVNEGPLTTIPPTTIPTTAGPPTTIAPPTIPPTTIPPTTMALSGPATIDQLIALLQPHPDAYGDRGSNLLGGLQDLQDERNQYPHSSSRVISRASDLSQNVDTWLQEGRLDPTIGADAQRLLAPLVNG